MVVDRSAPRGWPLGAGSRLLLLVAALAGLFAMHGLSDHGVEGSGMSAHAHMAVHAPLDSPTVVVTGTGGAAHMPGLMGVCVAVLGLGLVLVALRRFPIRGGRLLARRGGRPRPVTARARAPNPPDLRRLCVQRC